jgi:hypothetical protein
MSSETKQSRSNRRRPFKIVWLLTVIVSSVLLVRYGIAIQANIDDWVNDIREMHLCAISPDAPGGEFFNTVEHSDGSRLKQYRVKFLSVIPQCVYCDIANHREYDRRVKYSDHGRERDCVAKVDLTRTIDGEVYITVRGGGGDVTIPYDVRAINVPVDTRGTFEKLRDLLSLMDKRYVVAYALVLLFGPVAWLFPTASKRVRPTAEGENWETGQSRGPGEDAADH